jgi:hypothetical protein
MKRTANLQLLVQDSRGMALSRMGLQQCRHGHHEARQWRAAALRHVRSCDAHGRQLALQGRRPAHRVG